MTSPRQNGSTHIACKWIQASARAMSFVLLRAAEILFESMQFQRGAKQHHITTSPQSQIFGVCIRQRPTTHDYNLVQSDNRYFIRKAYVATFYILTTHKSFNIDFDAHISCPLSILDKDSFAGGRIFFYRAISLNRIESCMCIHVSQGDDATLGPVLLKTMVQATLHQPHMMISKILQELS